MKKVAVLISGVLMSGMAYASEYSFSYNSSELRTIESVQSLHQEIVKTAKEHCPSYMQTRSLADRRNCVNDVVSDLVQKVDNPTLTAYHQGDINTSVAQASK